LKSLRKNWRRFEWGIDYKISSNIIILSKLYPFRSFSSLKSGQIQLFFYKNANKSANILILGLQFELNLEF